MYILHIYTHTYIYIQYICVSIYEYICIYRYVYKYILVCLSMFILLWDWKKAIQKLQVDDACVHTHTSECICSCECAAAPPTRSQKRAKEICSKWAAAKWSSAVIRAPRARELQLNYTSPNFQTSSFASRQTHSFKPKRRQKKSRKQ